MHMQTDPVAAESRFLSMYMSNGHPETLIAYAKWYGKVKEGISSAEMMAIDSKSMTLTCTLECGSKKEVRVALNPPLSGYDQVTSRLIEMKAISQEGLGMIEVPKITTFKLGVPKGSSIAVTIGITFLVAFTWYIFLAPINSTSPIFLPANIVRSYLGLRAVELGMGFIVLCHFLESLYTFSLCRKHCTGFFVGAQYVIATIVVGYLSWISLREHIRMARIRSVMKME